MITIVITLLSMQKSLKKNGNEFRLSHNIINKESGFIGYHGNGKNSIPLIRVQANIPGSTQKICTSNAVSSIKLNILSRRYSIIIFSEYI